MILKTALIIEDEIPASERLKRLLNSENIEVIGQIQSVKKAVYWLENNHLPDFIFSDIKLSDGNSFEIFEKMQVTSKIIFTSAYEEFALKAFEVKGIAYLLKPIQTEQLQKVINDVSYFASIFEKDMVQKTTFEESFLVSFGSKLKKINSDEIVAFYSENNITYIQCFDYRTYPISKSLDKLETTINASIFFRINRSVLLNKNAIDYLKNSEIALKNQINIKDTSLSRSRVSAFKNWF